MNKKASILLGALLILGNAGCTTHQPLTDQAMYQQYPSVAELSRQLEMAKQNQLNILSPEEFKKAVETFSKSVELGRKEDQKAEALAKAGLNTLAQANSNAATARDVLEDVLKAREKAIVAKAPDIDEKGFVKAEKQLLELTDLIESGKISEAKAGRANALRSYSDIELSALKGNIVDVATDAIDKAKRKNVDELAPKTMNLALEEMRLASKTLDANRLDTEKAELHAKRALWQVQRATEIADIITNFKTSKFNEEDKILWYQDQISRIVSPVEPDISFNEPNKRVVKGLNARIAKLVEDQNAAQLALQETKAKLSSELQTAQAMTDAEKKRQKAIAAKFDFIQALYRANEAEVYRQKDNVLIRARGFAFNTGDSEIDARNFELMNKIIQSVAQFPNSKIVVSGHTDNRGSDKANEQLSKERAEKVAAFLTQVGKISADRIESVGYGKSQPIATNDTADGRAANRRVEILIVNTKAI